MFKKNNKNIANKFIFYKIITTFKNNDTIYKLFKNLTILYHSLKNKFNQALYSLEIFAIFSVKETKNLKL